MLWILGALSLVVWFVEKFLLHKGGLVHLFLLFAVGCFFFQFLQDRRTRQYESER